MKHLSIILAVFLLACSHSTPAAAQYTRNNSAATSMNGTNMYRGNAAVNEYGESYVRTYPAEVASTWSACTSAITDTTSTAIKAAGAAGVKFYVTSISVANTHATVATQVQILDGATVKWNCAAAAGGGGCTLSFPVPLSGTAATALNCKPVTTGTSTICCAAGFSASR